MDLTDRLIQLAIEEDVGPGDITTESLVGPDVQGRGIIIAKEPLVLAGLDVVKKVFEAFGHDILYKPEFNDGDTVDEKETVLTIDGSLHALLKGERIALNFLQRLSGIATHTRSYVKKLGNRNVRLVDTRKTTPGWRELEKFAVRMGGAHNHRMSLYDGVLIKDNHIAVSGSIKKAVETVRKNVPRDMKIEVEVTSMDEAGEAISAGADIIMLDNMTTDMIKKAVELICGKALVEVSGGVTMDSLRQLADTGADIISVGALTHSARAVDLSMRISCES